MDLDNLDPYTYSNLIIYIYIPRPIYHNIYIFRSEPTTPSQNPFESTPNYGDECSDRIQLRAR